MKKVTILVLTLTLGSFLLVNSPTSLAAPVAINDTYQTTEDTPVKIDTRSGLVGHWTFESGADLRDLTGNFGDLTLLNGASVVDGSLNLDAAQEAFSGAYTGPALTNKTLVAWLRMDSLTAQAGSPLSIEQTDVHGFDAIVYGELQPNHWMAGSDFFRRTQTFSPGFEETTLGELIQIAISYEDLGGGLVRIRFYRNGIQYGDYTSGNMRTWQPGVIAKFGPRVVGAGSIDAHIDEARIYERTLDGADLATLTLVKPQDNPNLVGEWNFDDGTARDTSGFGNHGVKTGGGRADGVRGTSLDLRGAGNYVTIPNSASLQTPHFTVAYWAKLTVLHNSVITTKRSASGAGDAWQASITSFGDGQQNLQLCLLAVNQACWYSPSLEPSPVGRWMHVVHTYDGSTMHQYADGVLVHSMVADYQPELGDAGITFGGHPSGAHNFEGLLDEVQIYDAALSADEVARLTAEGGLLSNDISASGAPLIAVKVTDPMNGTVNIASDGSLLYTPDSGFVGSDSFVYQAFDGTESSEEATVTIIVADTSKPVVTVPADISILATGAGGATVNFVTSATDNGSVLAGVTCAAAAGPVASGDMFPIGATPVSCLVADAAGNVSLPASFTVTVEDVNTQGKMKGDGFIRVGADKYKFKFKVSERELGLENGRLSLRIKTDERSSKSSKKSKKSHKSKKGKSAKHAHRGDGFRSTAITFVAFSDDPSIQPNIDTVLFTGTGKWNGQAGYTFEASAKDQGRPGRHRDFVSIVIRDQAGQIVAQVSGNLDGGNVKSKRIHHHKVYR